MTAQFDIKNSDEGVRTLKRARALASSALVALLLSACATAGDRPPQAAVPLQVSHEAIATAERAVEEGRYDDARLLLERALLTQPDHPRVLLALAEIRLAQGDLRSAIKGFGSLTDRHDVAARAYQGLGISLLLQGRDRDAEVALAEAIALDPGLWRAWNALGSYYDRLGQWDSAAHSYGQALAMRPDSAMLHNNRGFSNLLRHRYAAAIEDFGAALRLDPSLVTARENLRLALAWSGQYQQALLGVQQQDAGRALNNIGFVAIMRGDLGAAEAYLLRSMEVEPTFNRVAHKNLEYLRSLKAMKAAEAKG